jgi:2-polyprenyl-6-methoxyphenol hydroxylase-like FAD-dependent oxidoreductase
VTIGASVPTPGHVEHLPAFFLSQAGSLLAFHDSADNKTVQWATFIQTKERTRGEWDEYRDSGEAQAELKREWGHITAEPMRTLVQDLLDKPTKDILIWAPYAVPGDLPTWHTDRVCLMGDSAHAISPSGGQGTAQALEDVALMTRLLTSSQALSVGYPRLFEHFEKSRTERLDVIRKMTDRTLNTRFSTPNPWWWMAKKFMYRTGFSMMNLARYIRSNPVEYDVTTERIDLAK